jgi:hypothetical protein
VYREVIVRAQQQSKAKGGRDVMFRGTVSNFRVQDSYVMKMEAEMLAPV